MKVNLMFVLVLLGSFVAQPGICQSGALGLTSLVSTADPNLRVPASASLSWSSKAVRVYPDERLDVTTADRIFRNAIQNEAISKGYRMVADDSPADFELGYLLALSSSLEDDEMLRKFGFSPGLKNSSSGRPEKGTLVVILLSPRTGRSMWRGAIEAFADLGATDEERKQRAELAVGRLLRLMPDAK